MRTHRITIEIEDAGGASIGDVQHLVRDAIAAKCKRSGGVFTKKVGTVRVVSAHADDTEDSA